MNDLHDIDGLDMAHEVFTSLHAGQGCLVERIVSDGQTTQWLTQDHDEWVMVLAGGAVLEMGDTNQVHLQAGQWFTITAGQRHRVAWTERPTIWVAVHFPSPA